MRAKHFAPPQLSWRCLQVWRRNLLVWRKLAITSILGNLADPMFYMLALGYGLGALLPKVDGMPYITFLAAGTVCYSTMNSATFEALYSAFSRMHVQRTWDAIMNAPVSLDDIVFAEALWAAAKSFLSGMAILLIIWVLGLSDSAAGPVDHSAHRADRAHLRLARPDHDGAVPELRLLPVLLHARHHPDGPAVRRVFPGVAAAAVSAAGLGASSAQSCHRARAASGQRRACQMPLLLHVSVLAGYAVAAFYAALVLARRRLLT